jgi:hypothetical protein
MNRLAEAAVKRLAGETAHQPCKVLSLCGGAGGFACARALDQSLASRGLRSAQQGR